MDSAIRELGTCHPAVCRERCVGLGGRRLGRESKQQKGPWAAGCVPQCSHQPIPAEQHSLWVRVRPQSVARTAAWQQPQAQGGCPLSPSSDLSPSVSPKDQGEPLPKAQWLLCEHSVWCPALFPRPGLPACADCPEKGLGRE